MHDASLARPAAAAVLTDCWTGLAPLVYFDARPTPRSGQPAASRGAAPGSLRRLLRLIA
ncbi:hypothetical protein [Pseudomonas oryzae]|uniref:Uncharacterized protein n=1 Tax=Pseudomonas oryzae TaxID=1392877 RepID=A0A1H1PUU5_9PSED|nr:hypothetical protein [Pseudomonas oryzae]SDS14904.1 hypothetical protein SAMN05216221_1179 [Pseudomonas oryzae]